jgi:uncharacterized protein (DUF1501 family)
MSDSRSPCRREFLKAAAAGAASLAVADVAAAASHAPLGRATSCIFINLVGGPSHIDTFDPKPDAPAEVRGPFRTIPTRMPGLQISELFPKLAAVTDKFSLIRTMHHMAPPVHECGFQLLNTGRLFRDGPEQPHMGAVVAYLSRQAGKRGEYSVFPNCEVNTGISISHGLGHAHLPGEVLQAAEPTGVGGFSLEKAVTLAGMMTTQGTPFVVVNMYQTVFDSVSWDCHADGGSLRTDLNDIRNTVAPAFDAAFSRLIQRLDESGRLNSTLVVATGEFGRTPLLNANGGRDHWAGAWTALVAGGGVQGGRVIGRTDAKGTEPADRPVTPQELVATVYHALGVPPDATIPGPSGEPVAVYPGKPVLELFRA